MVVMAYHDIGFRCLEILIRRKQNVVAVFTHENDPDETIWFRSVADLAVAHGLPCYVPENVNAPHWIDLLKRLRPDILFSFYFRQMLSREILDIPILGAINLHGSYLPKYRGRCPVNWVLVNGETETGVTLHYMVERPDAGDIIARTKVAIDLQDTAFTLYHKMERASARLLGKTLPRILAGTNRRIPQDLSQGSYFGGRHPEDGKIDWTRTSVEIYNLIRAVTRPYPGAFSYLRGQKVLIWRAERLDTDVSTKDVPPGTIEVHHQSFLVKAGRGALRVLACQLEGGPELETSRGLETLLHHGDRFDQGG
jgi:methionyl-tRNA formyltransferase